MTKDNKEKEPSFWEINCINPTFGETFHETDLDPELIEQKLMEDSRTKGDANLKTHMVGYPKEKWSKKMQDFYKSLPSNVYVYGPIESVAFTKEGQDKMRRELFKKRIDKKLANPEEEVLCPGCPIEDEEALIIEEINNKLVVRCPKADCKFNLEKWDEEEVQS